MKPAALNFLVGSWYDQLVPMKESMRENERVYEVNQRVAIVSVRRWNSPTKSIDIGPKLKIISYTSWKEINFASF